MALKTFVKVGSISNLSDARYCAGMGVDLLGFNVIEGHQHFIASKQFQEIRGWVTGPLIVAELYGMKSAADLANVLEGYRPDYLEVSTRELPLIADSSLPFILSLQADETIEQSITPAYVIIPEGSPYIASLARAFDVLIAADETDGVQSLLDTFNPTGITLSGSPELKPGLKDYQGLADILEALDED